MPIYEAMCGVCGQVQEFYVPRWDSPDPACECGGETRRMVSAFSVVFTGTLSASKYNQDVKGGLPEQRHMDGQVVWRTKSSKSGKPERCVLRTFEDRRKFMKDEGLIGIEDVGNIEATPDGKMSSGRGMGGQWV